MGKKTKIGLLLGGLAGVLAGGAAARKAARNRGLSARDAVEMAKERVSTVTDSIIRTSNATDRLSKLLRLSKAAGWSLGSEGKVDADDKRTLLRIVTRETLVVLKLTDDGNHFVIDQLGYNDDPLPPQLDVIDPTFEQYEMYMASRRKHGDDTSGAPQV